VIEFTDPRTQNLMRKGVFDPKKKRLRECWTSVKYNPFAGTNADRVIISFNLSQRRSP
jgi:hypothetical protein